MRGHGHSASTSTNQKAALATAYSELGRELSSTRLRIVGNYTLGKTIGAGTYGTVRLGTHRLTSARVAIKQIPKAMGAGLTREIHHHRRLHHPHVAQLYEVIATESHIWLVTELCAGGELFDYLAEKGRLGERPARVLFGQLCLALAYVHGLGIVHRDLKLENVLLDERCRVKLGDFGFTREWEANALLETFCGTTGYASPEMLEGKRYTGPEVDVWSLGVILYCLLTGGLPFDDDDESIMRLKVIRAEFADPAFLTPHARSLLHAILEKDVSKRATIPQILAHPWFSADLPAEPAPADGETLPTGAPVDAGGSTTSASASEEGGSRSSATTPDPSDVPTSTAQTSPTSLAPAEASVSRRASQATIRSPADTATPKRPTPPTVPEEKEAVPPPPPLERVRTNESISSPALPTRTPVRTKRRSVSSALGSAPGSPVEPDSAGIESGGAGVGAAEREEPERSAGPGTDFARALSKPAPVIFGTKLERELLNSLSALGFDTGQVVHSVLTNACDSAGAVWWMLKRRAERRALEAAEAAPVLPAVASSSLSFPPAEPESPTARKSRPTDMLRARRSESPGERRGKGSALAPLTTSTPALAFIPPTPVAPQHDVSTPPARAPSPGTSRIMLTPSLTDSSIKSGADSSIRSSTSTPGAGSPAATGGGSTKGRAKRSGSVSIMQRATTALEAAGLVRKKSAEVLGGEREAAAKESEDASSARTRSPDAIAPASTPGAAAAEPDGTWVLAPPGGDASEGTGSPRDTLTALPVITPGGVKSGHARNRGSLLSTFRMWFDQDRRGKGNAAATTSPKNVVGRGAKGKGKAHAHAREPSTPATRAAAAARAAKRASMSSARSSSVNSRRSSGASMLESHALDMARTRSDASRRSRGSRTPSSEPGEWFGGASSRPGSAASYARRGERHRKSPSQSSAGSAARGAGAASPYHRRGGSGGSTRVVRAPQAPPPRRHGRSNSTASSIHSLASSRRNSFYEGASDGEGARAGSPARLVLDEGTPRRGAATFVAQKRAPLQGLALRPGGNSWKKAWGREPPGWAARPAVEVLALLDPPSGGADEVRDVFGAGGAGAGDEDEWVDEDDGYAGGLGQLPAGARTGAEEPPPVSPAVARGMGARTGVGLGFGFGAARRESEVVLDPPPESRRRGAGGKGGGAGGFRSQQPAVVEEEEEPEEE